MMDSKLYTFETGGGHLAAVINDVERFFDDDTQTSTLLRSSDRKKKLEYISWGADNNYPQELINLLGKDEVLGPNKQFNITTCYGAGVRYTDSNTSRATTKPDIVKFLRRNNMAKLELERITDMKYFFFDVVVVILNKARNKIVKVRHKEASYVRFAKAKNGVIPYIYYADWKDGKADYKDIEQIELLDEWDPVGDLMVKLGKEPGDDGHAKVRTNSNKFAILTKFPTVGNRYYPDPYYLSFLRSDWYDIKRMIPLGKKMKMKNSTSLRYLVEIKRDYWSELYREFHITGEEEKKAFQKEKMEEIEKFVSGIENSGKTWFSSFMVDPVNGSEISDVKVTVLKSDKEGGDWSEDAEEANNIACYADGVHPNLVGATPGKSKMNNSGSDKRELFTMKQHMELPFHHIMKIPHELICEFNGWNDIVIDHPIITLTTLDKGKDAEIKDTNQLKSTNDDM